MSKCPSTPHNDLEELFGQACALHESGRLDEAVEAYRQLLTRIPSSPLLHFNCGLALFETGNFPAAEEHYQKALQTQTQDSDIHYNRGLNFRRLGNLQDAISSFEEAYRLGDTSVDTLYNMALSYQDKEEYQQASRLYDTILEITPEHLSSLNNYAFLCHKSGDSTKAEQLYRQLLKYNPQHKAAQHMLDSLLGNSPDTAPLEYVEAIFDNYANGFEQSLLNKLHYQTPMRLRELYRAHFPDDKRKHCLDLGCGTGLAGVELTPYCQQLTGIDISEEMLRVAHDKEIYQQLLKGDIQSFFESSNTFYDMMVAADVFTYMGDLEKIFKGCSSQAMDQALFLFSVEDSTTAPYQLKPSGRFGHSVAYIQALSHKYSWQTINCTSSQLRQDKGQWIEGKLLLLQKNARP